MNQFCASANLKSFASGPACPPALRAGTNILEKCYDISGRGTLKHDMRTLDGAHDRVPTMDASVPHSTTLRKAQPLESDIYDALVAWSQQSPVPPNVVHSHSHLTIRGNQYAPWNATPRNSVIFFQPTDSDTMVPGVIRQIFSLTADSNALLAVHRYRALPEGQEDPFISYKDLGIGLWSQQHSDTIEIIDSSQ